MLSFTCLACDAPAIARLVLGTPRWMRLAFEQPVTSRPPGVWSLVRRAGRSIRPGRPGRWIGRAGKRQPSIGTVPSNRTRIPDRRSDRFTFSAAAGRPSGGPLLTLWQELAGKMASSWPCLGSAGWSGTIYERLRQISAGRAPASLRSLGGAMLSQL